jgi:hypothetical protein
MHEPALIEYARVSIEYARVSIEYARVRVCKDPPTQSASRINDNINVGYNIVGVESIWKLLSEPMYP